MINDVRLREAVTLPPDVRLEALLHLSEEGLNPDDRAQLALALVDLIAEPALSAKQRMALGEALGQLGDPRLQTPKEDGYWVRVHLDDDRQLDVGRYPVTTAEWLAFVESDRYNDAALWDAAGIAWRDGDRPSWRSLAAAPDSAHLIIPNQPAVGVSWYEAMAYARAHGSRLLEYDERVLLMRGTEKRPYPWGQPFGQGNANTREEVLGKPSAVGVFFRDQTPEGIFDLAGNVGEWTADVVGELRVIHPGSWEQPSMAAWAKALHIISPAARAADLGFRLARGVVEG
ncbi:MAG: SUMF1/EgtB/PvdO family nonheme iron enzyme [Myxococcota bacterium]